MYSEKQKETLLKIAREAINSTLKGGRSALIPDIDNTLKMKRAAFVTLTIKGQLRGCIGYIKPYKPLFQTIDSLAKAAAFEDPRFPPLSEKEISDLKIEISVLSEMELIPIQELERITIGKHGLYIVCRDDTGLLLPQVAVENNWDVQQFLHHVCLKAGLPPDVYTRCDCELYIFSAEIFSEKG